MQSYTQRFRKQKPISPSGIRPAIITMLGAMFIDGVTDAEAQERLLLACADRQEFEIALKKFRGYRAVEVVL